MYISRNTVIPKEASFIPEVVVSAFADTYTLVVTAPSDSSFVWLRVVNGTDQAVTISFDGVNDHFTVLSNQQFYHSFLQNVSFKGNEVYLKQTSAAPTTGAVYIGAYS